jgi:ADP-heptose:LPS heptosyltransferase
VLSLCAVCVGDDTDAAHLAAAVRTPVVAIHGETDPTRVGPASETATAFSRTSCACARSSPLGLCAKCVPVDEVLSAIESYAAERWPWDRVQQMFGRP